jgi:hypothetical protein
MCVGGWVGVGACPVVEVGDPAGSAGGRLDLHLCRSCARSCTPSVRILSKQTFRVAGVWILSTQTLQVARVRILLMQTFGAFVGRKHYDSYDKLSKMTYKP